LGHGIRTEDDVLLGVKLDKMYCTFKDTNGREIPHPDASRYVAAYLADVVHARATRRFAIVDDATDRVVVHVTVLNVGVWIAQGSYSDTTIQLQPTQAVKVLYHTGESEEGERLTLSTPVCNQLQSQLAQSSKHFPSRQHLQMGLLHCPESPHKWSCE
jgi:hypothetical protein